MLNPFIRKLFLIKSLLITITITIIKIIIIIRLIIRIKSNFMVNLILCICITCSTITLIGWSYLVPGSHPLNNFTCIELGDQYEYKKSWPKVRRPPKSHEASNRHYASQKATFAYINTVDKCLISEYSRLWLSVWCHVFSQSVYIYVLDLENVFNQKTNTHQWIR